MKYPNPYRRCSLRIRAGGILATTLVPFLFATPILGQQPNTTPPPPASSSAEITTEDKPTTFKLRVNVVEVHVVVRDSKGNAVPGLKREDFRLLDQGKPQTITNFA